MTGEDLTQDESKQFQSGQAYAELGNDRPFSGLSEDEQDERRYNASPEDWRASVTVNNMAIVEELDRLGPESREQNIGRPEELRQELRALTPVLAVLDKWEAAGATMPFTDYVAEQRTRIDSGEIPIDDAILGTETWLSECERYLTEALMQGDEVAGRGDQDEEDVATNAGGDRPLASDGQEAAAQIAREAIERISQQATIEAAVKYGSGHTSIDTDIGVYSFRVGDESSETTARRLQFRNQYLEKARLAVDWKAPGWKYHPSEMVAFTPIVEPGPDNGGLVARTTRHPETGAEEPAVLFQYSFDRSGAANSNWRNEVAAGERSKDYQIRDGRDGNHFNVGLVLPASIAGELQTAVLDNPNVARDLIKLLVADNRSSSIAEGTWSLPPYDNLPPGWAILVGSIDNSNPNSPPFGVTLEEGRTDGRALGDTTDPYKLKLVEVG